MPFRTPEQPNILACKILDIGDLLTQHTRRIPLATWYRFRIAAEQVRIAFLLFTQSPCASSCAALVLRCEPSSAIPFNNDGETALFERSAIHADTRVQS
jgi:hypothetical protein